jgi:lipid-A-disaccharide synthase
VASPCILVTAVEPSADLLGAQLVRALARRLPAARFVGVGGPELAAAGLVSAFDPAALAVVGVANAARIYPKVRWAVRQTVEAAQRERPDVAVLIDAWGFSIRLATALRRILPGLPLVKYIAPQVWATRAWRSRALARRVDRLLTILPFEAPMFEAAGLAVDFVGNPALARRSGQDPPPEREPRTVLVLPGSRAGEVRRLMPAFGEAIDRLAALYPDLRVILGVAPSVADQAVAAARAWTQRPDEIARSEDQRDTAMRRATAALACSGTVTTQLAVAGCPMVVAYRLDVLTYPIARLLIRTPWVTLLNVAARRFVVPERIQGRCTGPALAADLARLLDDPALQARQASEQNDAVALLAGGIEDPVGAAADAIVRVLNTVTEAAQMAPPEPTLL